MKFMTILESLFWWKKIFSHFFTGTFLNCFLVMELTMLKREKTKLFVVDFFDQVFDGYFLTKILLDIFWPSFLWIFLDQAFVGYIFSQVFVGYFFDQVFEWIFVDQVFVENFLSRFCWIFFTKLLDVFWPTFCWIFFTTFFFYILEPNFCWIFYLFLSRAQITA